MRPVRSNLWGRQSCLRAGLLAGLSSSLTRKPACRHDCLPHKKLCFLALLACLPVTAEVNRVVILKVDGIPERLVERYTAESAEGGRTGHSRLPWIQHVFEKNGTWMENFYVRGLSLSAPSWSLLDTGRPLVIRGNIEYDRYTLRAYVYLYFFPFYTSYVLSRPVCSAYGQLMDQR